jgi:hypothetical protein
MYSASLLSFLKSFTFVGYHLLAITYRPQFTRVSLDKVSAMREQEPAYRPYLYDFILGFADGMTVPFALTAGLSS